MCKPTSNCTRLYAHSEYLRLFVRISTCVLRVASSGGCSRCRARVQSAGFALVFRVLTSTRARSRRRTRGVQLCVLVIAFLWILAHARAARLWRHLPQRVAAETEEQHRERCNCDEHTAYREHKSCKSNTKFIRTYK